MLIAFFRLCSHLTANILNQSQTLFSSLKIISNLHYRPYCFNPHPLAQNKITKTLIFFNLIK